MEYKTIFMIIASLMQIVGTVFMLRKKEDTLNYANISFLLTIIILLQLI